MRFAAASTNTHARAAWCAACCSKRCSEARSDARTAARRCESCEPCEEEDDDDDDEDGGDVAADTDEDEAKYEDEEEAEEDDKPIASCTMLGDCPSLCCLFRARVSAAVICRSVDSTAACACVRCACERERTARRAGGSDA